MNDIRIIQHQYNMFYRQFKCLECGRCCTQSPSVGGILLQPGDIERLSQKLGLSKRKFKDTYTYVGDDQKRRIRYPCPFHTKERGCTVYLYRTKMCHDYPVIGYDAGQKKVLVDSNCAGVQKMVADAAMKEGQREHPNRPSGELRGVPPVAGDKPLSPA